MLSHREFGTPLYKTWANMKQRCFNSRSPWFGRYGARGITVYEPWKDYVAFATFVKEHLGPRPEGYSLDRIDNNGSYAPENIRWASTVTQRANRRSLKGVAQCCL